jgi:hypothetical protein
VRRALPLRVEGEGDRLILYGREDVGGLRPGMHHVKREEVRHLIEDAARESYERGHADALEGRHDNPYP